MAISIVIPERQKLAKRTFRFEADLWETFDQYVKAAQAQYADASEAIVLAEILRTHMSKDRAFQHWRKTQGLNGHRTNGHKMKGDDMGDLALCDGWRVSRAHRGPGHGGWHRAGAADAAQPGHHGCRQATGV